MITESRKILSCILSKDNEYNFDIAIIKLNENGSIVEQRKSFLFYSVLDPFDGREYKPSHNKRSREHPAETSRKPMFY